MGTLVTIFLSNDATAVVLTPAVYAAATAARVEPLPYLLICAFIANAASFVLPISNPANLVIFGAHMPPLATWLAHFTLPSIAAIVVTYVALHFTQRRALDQRIAEKVARRRRCRWAARALRSASAWRRWRFWRPRRSTGRSACRPSSPAWR